MEQDKANTANFVNDMSRPFKRRKFHRKRADSPNDDLDTSGSPDISKIVLPPHTVANEPPVMSQPEDLEQTRDDDSHLIITELLRRRKVAQRRRGGIEFTNNAPATERSVEQPRPGEEVLENEDSLDKILTVVDRFAPQTGQVADVDKHMYEVPQIRFTGAKMQILTV
ncbi:MAG: hypothetical protein Q9184_006263, partial [Pyrenodesmia sp. 2 TL-2023]